MADESNDILRQYYPGSPNWLSPEDMRRGILDRYGPQNQFALPPKPRPVVENDHTRPDAYVDKNVREWVGPGAALAGAYGLGRTIGTGYEDFKLGDYKSAAAALPEIAMAMAPMPGPKRMPHRVENPIRAYHGSPHDFDRFDLSKIGTGEGAQAFGHGIYFAEHEPVAMSYRDALAPRNYDKPAVAARWALDETGGDATGAVQKLRDAMAWHEKNGGLTDAKRTELSDAIRHVETGAHKGRMYEVAIHASPDQFLDWDKPLSQQSEAVRKALTSTLDKAGVKPDAYRMPVNYPDGRKEFIEPASRAFEELSAAFDGHRGASMPGAMGRASERAAQELSGAGVPGIRYLDQGSRGKGEGTANYVVFNPELIEIMRKYGLLGPVAGLSTADILAQYNKPQSEQQ